MKGIKFYAIVYYETKNGSSAEREITFRVDEQWCRTESVVLDEAKRAALKKFPKPYNVPEIIEHGNIDNIWN